MLSLRQMGRISSRRHPLVQRYRLLARGRADGQREMLLEGSHLVRDALDAHCSIAHAAFTAAARGRREGQTLLQQLTRAGVETTEVTDDVMTAVSPVKTPWGLVAIAARPDIKLTKVFQRTPQLVALAVDVQDPGNLGAMIRAAEAGGATGVVACGMTADPFGWRALRGSMGSAFRLPVARATTDEAFGFAQKNDILVFATAPRGGRSPFDLDLRQPLVFALGGEGPGLPPHLTASADAIVTIPMEPPVESLNVAISTALLVYEARRQREG